MATHNIKTPPGFKTDGGTFEFNAGFGSDWSGRFNAAQRVVDSEVLRYNDPYVPKDQGEYINSGQRSTVIGSGEVVYNTPYARRWYYENANFQGAPMRGARHFERMRVDHKDDILRSAGKEFNK